MAKLHPCPVCGLRSLDGEEHDICSICHWHDEYMPVCDCDPIDIPSDANSGITIRAARQAYRNGETPVYDMHGDNVSAFSSDPQMIQEIDESLKDLDKVMGSKIITESAEMVESADQARVELYKLWESCMRASGNVRRLNPDGSRSGDANPILEGLEAALDTLSDLGDRLRKYSLQSH